MSQIENAERQLAQDKQQANQYAQKLDSAETIQCLVDTRFEQLDKAIAIDLWQVYYYYYTCTQCECYFYCIRKPLKQLRVLISL